MRGFILSILLLCGLFALLDSCKPKDELIDPAPGQALRFDDDTLFFDTVFTQRRTVTHRVRVFNPNPKAITLSQVRVGAASSPFSFYVNGQASKDGVVKDVQILGNDSAYVLVSAELGSSGRDSALLIRDSLNFTVGGRGGEQRVQLMAYGQDAHYLRDDSGLVVLPCNTVFTPDKPWVLLNSVFVPYGCTLTVQAGAKVRLFANANIFVQGTLLVQGTKEHKALFAGTRLERDYQYIPGQWGAIVLLDSSQGNRIDGAIIENGLRGVQVNLPGTVADPASVVISNTLIRNMSDVGIYGFSGNVLAYNTVIADCQSFNIAGLQGGYYRFWHCTTAYSGNTPFSRKNQSVAFADNYEDQAQNKVFVNRLKLNLYNNIISGDQDEELFIGPAKSTDPLDTILMNNYITSRRGLWRGANKFHSGNADFYKPYYYDFHPDSLMPGVVKQGGLPLSQIQNRENYFSALVRDFIYVDRPAATPTIGAYEPLR